MASSNNEKRVSKKNSEILVVNLDNIDEYCTRGFIDCSNIQEDEYSERADVILERIQDESRRQDSPKENQRKLCDHLKSLFHQKLRFLQEHQGRPVAQVVCKAAMEERQHFSSYIPTIWATVPKRPVEHKIILLGCPRNIRIMVIHPKE